MTNREWFYIAEGFLIMIMVCIILSSVISDDTDQDKYTYVTIQSGDNSEFVYYGKVTENHDGTITVYTE